jgi:adenylate kinase family enzyme
VKKVIIIGSGGSGKSTAAIKLGEITGLPVIHLDSYFWKPDWIQVGKDEWLLKIKELCEQPRWIMDGNYRGTMDLRFNEADTIIFLYFPRLLCLWGIMKRRFSKRPDTIEGCREKIDLEFFKWVWNFNMTHVPDIMEKLNNIKDKNVYILRNRKQLNKLFESIKERQKTLT